MCLKCMGRTTIAAAVLSVWSSSAGLADATTDALTKQARGIVKAFAGELKQTLVSAIKDVGPGHAIGVCNVAAPSIAEQKSVKGWNVARTSLKLRNKSNAPDTWEAKVLATFEKRKGEGEDPKKIDHAEVVTENGKKIFRYMKAIPAGKPCMACHGKAVDPELYKKIKALYPDDVAIGFKPGDLRGAFTLKKQLN